MKIYAIPGLGTTEKLYENTHIENHTVVILKWPIPSKNDTMETYAKKFIPQINQNEPFCLLGVSFGGMICNELCKIVNPVKTIIVSSAKSRLELPWFIKLLNVLPVHKVVSEQMHRKMAYHGKWFIGFGTAYIPEYLGMVNSMTENYFKYCINIIVSWKRKENDKAVIHIHGTADRLLLYKNVTCNYTIDNGSHAMVVFRAEEINKIIETEIVKGQ